MKLFSKIEKNLVEKYHLKQKELQKIVLLFSFSFCLGLFIAFYFVPANSEFVQYYGSKQLPVAYIFSGIVGTLVIAMYSKIQKSAKSRRLFMSAVIVMLCVSLLSKFFLYFIEHYKFNVAGFNYDELKKYLSFFVFIWAWPFIALTGIITGGIALKLLNLIQIKKYFGLINIGGIIASILGYFIIPVFLKYLSHHYDFILIGTIGLIAAIFLIFKIYKSFPECEKVENKNIEENEVTENNFWKLISKKFFLLIFLAATLSTIAIYISDYGFLVTIKEQDTLFKNKQDVALFLSIIFGLLKIGELILSIFSSRILSRGGVKLGMLIMPFTVLLLLGLSFICGSFAGTASISFLALITLNKSFERILRRGLDDPSFNVLYQTLPENQKLFVQTRVGVIMQISIALAGGLLYFVNIFLSSDGDFNLKLYPILVLPVIAIWVLISMKMYAAYKEKIRQILAEKRMFEFNYSEDEVFGSQILEKHLLGEDLNVATFSVVVLAETNPRSLEAYAGFLLKIENKTIRKVILKSIDPTYNERINSIIEEIGNKINFKEREIHKLILSSLYNLDYTEINHEVLDIFEKLRKSQLLRDKIKLTKFLFKNEIENDEPVILELLDYHDKTVKLAAIKIAGERKTEKLLKKLVELLDNAEYNNLLVNIFVEIGEKILPHLDEHFTEKTNNVTLLKIIEVYAKTGSKQAINLLVSHLDFPDREIQSAIIIALYYTGFKADEENTSAIKKKISCIAENILWFFVTIKDIEKEKNTLKLIQSLDLERENTFKLLFYLLSFIYPLETIDLIKTNIIGENTIFALEIIDNFISKDIKRLIIPLLDKLSVNQRIRKLKPFFYIPEMGFNSRLKDIVLKDYKKIDLWTQTKAIELLGKLMKNLPKNAASENQKMQINDNETWTEERANFILKLIDKEDIPDEIFTCLYHNSELIYSTAASVIYEYSPVMCVNYLKNLSSEKQKLINILTNNDGESLLPDKVKLLKRVFLFYTVPEKSLEKLARIINSAKKKTGDSVSFTNKNGNEDIIILIKGNLVFNDKKYGNYNFTNNDVIIKGLHVPQNIESLNVEKNAFIIFINRFDFFNLLVTDKEIIKHLFDRMKF